MTVLILGHSEDAHAAYIARCLSDRGVANYYWDTRLFPSRIALAWQPHTDQGYIQLPDVRLALSTIRSVYWRSFMGVQVPELGLAGADGEALIAARDCMSLLRSLLQIESIRWVNSWFAYQFHQEKPRQLQAVHRLGVKIPATLVSNDVVSLQEFAATHTAVIFKPIYGGAHTQLLTPEHLKPERLTKVLKIAPVTLQENVHGTNIRSYVLGEAVYSAEIRSPKLDFREDNQAEIIAIQTPPNIAQQCRQIARCLGLEWTAIDWRMPTTGEYIFLEANPSPMFIYFEQQTGFPITEKLLALLID